MKTLIIIIALLASNQTEKGIASWYGGKWHGNRTASGEVYNMNALTAAHHTLGFDTIVRVYYKNDSVDVRINDRGNFHKPKYDKTINGVRYSRIIDLSKAAADSLNLGCDLVTLRIIELNNTKHKKNRIYKK